MFTLEKLVALKQKAVAATRVSHAFYEAMCTEIEVGELKLNTNIGGLKIVTIWEAKPTAWRPRPAYEYHFPEVDAAADGPFLLPQGMTLDGDFVRQYFDAAAIAKDLWSQFDIEYQLAVAAHQRGELDPVHQVKRSVGMFYTLQATLLHVYEVKVVK